MKKQRQKRFYEHETANQQKPKLLQVPCKIEEAQNRNTTTATTAQ